MTTVTKNVMRLLKKRLGEGWKEDKIQYLYIDESKNYLQFI